MSEIDPALPIGSHLSELRTRLLRSILALGLAFAACYGYADPLVQLLMSPLELFLEKLGRGGIIATGLTEYFIVQLKVSLLAGFFIALPIIAWQMYQFLRPAFRGQEKAYFVWLFVLGGILFSVGANFGYFGVLPYGIEFLVNLIAPGIDPQLTISDYFAFAARLMLAFGLVFELPMAVTLLARLGIVDRRFFKEHRRIAILIVFVAAAILTPPDPMTQVMLAVPLVLLYEISAQIAYWVGQDSEDAEGEEETVPESAEGAVAAAPQTQDPS